MFSLIMYNVNEVNKINVFIENKKTINFGLILKMKHRCIFNILLDLIQYVYTCTFMKILKVDRSVAKHLSITLYLLNKHYKWSCS